jgi:acetyl esterase
MDAQAKEVLKRIATLSPMAAPNNDDAHWLAMFRNGVANLRAFAAPPEPVASVTNVIADGVPTRLYRPAEGRLPLLLHIHGGGAIAGSVDGHDSALRALANRTGWLVAAPGYRLAPEHPFPAMLDDAWTALNWLAEHGGEFNIDTSRIVVSGDSIGGALTAAITLMARDQGGPALIGQIPIYPNTDLRRDAPYPSRRKNDGIIIGLPMLERQVDLYLSSETDRENPLASPILAESLAGLPPALLVTCECDPLLDEGEAYAKRLSEAGVPVRLERFDGQIHAFLQMGGFVDDTERLLALIAEWLRGL